MDKYLINKFPDVPFWNTFPDIFQSPVFWIHVDSFQIHLDFSSRWNGVFADFYRFIRMSCGSATNKSISKENQRDNKQSFIMA